VQGAWGGILCALLLAAPAAAERPLDAAATDQTESPFTVGPGRFLIETAAVAYTRDRSGGRTEETWSVLETTLRAGLLEGLDGEIFLQPYKRVDDRDGVGNLTLRAKLNAWGDAPEPWETSFGVLPFLEIPTGGDVGRRRVEGGVALPAAWRIGPAASLHGMLQVAAVRDAAGNDYDAQLQHTAELVVTPFGPPLGGLSPYLEYAGTAAVEGSADYVAQLATGLTLQLGADTAVDVGVILGLNEAAPTARTALNLTLRF
jgi:hypothetical protein